MPRTKPADQRRLDLLDAAEVVFVEHGVAGATIDHVTTQAGVAKGTFYLYFRSKEELIASVHRRYAEAFATQLVDALDATDDWTDKLDGIVRAWFDDYANEQVLHDVLFAHITKTASEDHVETFESLVRTFREALTGGVEAGAYRVDDIETTGLLLFNAVHGSYDAVWQGSDRHEERRLVLATQTLFRRAVGLPDPSGG